METFLSSLSNELFKLRRRKKYLVFLILGCAICVISALRVLFWSTISPMEVWIPRRCWGAHVLQPHLYPADLPPPHGGDGGQRPVCGGAGGPHHPFFPHAPGGKGKLFFSKALAVFVLCAFDLAVMYLVTTLAQVGLGRGAPKGCSPVWGPACWT